MAFSKGFPPPRQMDRHLESSRTNDLDIEMLPHDMVDFGAVCNYITNLAATAFLKLLPAMYVFYVMYDQM